MKAVIMAGGEGTRLRPLTCTMPKPMVPVVNKPMMEHILDLLKKHDFHEIASTLWYMPEVIQDYFGDGSNYNVSIEYFIEPKQLGTAGSVKNAESFLDETFIVVSGDCLTDINLQFAVDFHRRKGALVTIVLTEVPNPLSYGVVITDEKGRIVRFVEKPSWSEVFSDTVNTGIYIIEPEALTQIPKNEKFDFSQDLFPKLLEQGAPLYGYTADGYWSDVGGLEAYRQAQYDCLSGQVKIELPEAQSSSIWIDIDADIADDVQITGPVYIGKDAKITSGCCIGPYTVISSCCQLDPGADIKRSVLWPHVKVGADSQLRGAVLASNACVGAKTQVYEGSIVGEKSIIGSRTIIEPNVKIWPHKQIAAGSRLSDSVVWGSHSESTLFTKDGIKGDIRTSLTPEKIVRFGLAYGAFVGRGGAVLVSSDGSELGRVAKRALISGLLAAGINVYDTGSVHGILARFGVSYIKVDGGLHCRTLVEQENSVNIICWDQHGYWLSKDEQRRIENLFLREDFPRVGAAEIGALAYVPKLAEQYIASAAKLYAPYLQGFRLKISGNEQELADLAGQFLTRAGCSIVRDDPELIIRIADQQWEIADPSGSALTDDQWWELFIYNQKLKSQDRVAVPVHVSNHVAKTAKQQNMEVVWTKTDPRVWMEIASELGNVRVDPESEIEYFPFIDPLVSIGEALSYLRQTGTTLDEIRFESTQNRAYKTVYCPWESKGRVMRSMISAADLETAEFLDGIRYYLDSGWALVVPDGDEPLFHVFCEAQTSEEADALAQVYADQIENFLLGGEA